MYCFGGENQPPATPSQPTGATQGEPGVSYSYSTFTTDPDEDSVYYYFDWGDGATSGWRGPYTSGTSITIKHQWENTGTYAVKVKAKDSLDQESEWSSPLTVLIDEDSALPAL